MSLERKPACPCKGPVAGTAGARRGARPWGEAGAAWRSSADTGGGNTTQGRRGAPGSRLRWLGPGAASRRNWGWQREADRGGEKTRVSWPSGDAPGTWLPLETAGREGEQVCQVGRAGYPRLWSGGRGPEGHLELDEATGPGPCGDTAWQGLPRAFRMPCNARDCLSSIGRVATVHVRLSHPLGRAQGLAHSADDFCRNQSGWRRPRASLGLPQEWLKFKDESPLGLGGCWQSRGSLDWQSLPVPPHPHEGLPSSAVGRWPQESLSGPHPPAPTTAPLATVADLSP